MENKINCIVIDDEPLGIQLLTGHIDKVPELNLVASFRSAASALATLANESIDLIFLDIHMPEISGMQFAKSMADPPPIIFTTAHRDYAVESYELNVIDYLLKPVSFERFVKAISKFQQHVRQSQPISRKEERSDEDAHIFLNTNKKFIKVAFKDIHYVESLKDYLRVHTRDAKVVTKGKISAFALNLPPQFLRVHRSFIVNLDQVTAYTAHDIEIDEIEIPIGGNYKDVVMQRLK